MVIKNSHLINPARDEEISRADIKIDGGIISAIDSEITPSPGETVIDAKGSYVFPGFIDLHVHLRDPGQTEKEDVVTGSRAAACGGYTTVCAMPNTTPVADSPEIIKYVQDKAEDAGYCRVFQVGSITRGMRGEEISDIRGMKAEGMMALSEDGKSVMDSGLMLDAMRLAGELGIPILDHCEDASLVRGGVMNSSAAERFGLPGISNAVENIIAVRDVMLAQMSGCRLHLCHNSTRESADIIREAKARGIDVTGEVCPHHFTLSDSDIREDDAMYKMNPPLRAEEDVRALREGLRDGVFDVIATDHAPHTPEQKSRGFSGSPFGIVGLETAASLTYSELVLTGLITPLQMAQKMSLNPARILGIDRGDISPGKAADLTIFDQNEKFEIHAADFRGKSSNMPYEGRSVTGRVKYTILNGRITYDHQTDK